MKLFEHNFDTTVNDFFFQRRKLLWGKNGKYSLARWYPEKSWFSVFSNVAYLGFPMEYRKTRFCCYARNNRPDKIFDGVSGGFVRFDTWRHDDMKTVFAHCYFLFHWRPKRPQERLWATINNDKWWRQFNLVNFFNPLPRSLQNIPFIKQHAMKLSTLESGEEKYCCVDFWFFICTVNIKIKYLADELVKALSQHFGGNSDACSKL